MAPFIASIGPYILIAWGLTELDEGIRFWPAIGWLIAGRTVISVIEGLSAVALWRLWGRRKLTDEFCRMLRDNRMPKREYREDSAGTYLHRIDADEECEVYKPKVRVIAAAIIGMEKGFAACGLFQGMRFSEALERALVIHSPPSASRSLGDLFEPPPSP